MGKNNASSLNNYLMQAWQAEQDRRAAAAAQAYRINKQNWELNNQKQAKDFSYQQQNKNYIESQNIAKIKAEAAAAQAQLDAATQAQISAIRSQQSAAIAGINSRSKMLDPQFKEDKYNEINPKILQAISDSGENYAMYNALGGDKPVTRSSLGLADQMHSGSQIANMNNVAGNTYSRSLQRASDNLAKKYQDQGYSSDSPLLSGLMDSQAGLSRTMQEGAAQKNYTDTKQNNQQYALDSNKLLNSRIGTLADLKSSTQQGNSALLGLLGKGL